MSRYTVQTTKVNSPSLAIEDSKKKASLLKDNSWIKKDDEEDESVDHDPNFGRSVLSRYRFNETTMRSEPDETKPRTTSLSTSVQALSKRYSGSQDEVKTSTLPSTRTTSYTRNTYSPLRSGSPKTYTTTTSKSSVTEEPKSSTTTTTVTKDGKTTETTITTTRTAYSSYSPTRTTRLTETTLTSNKDPEDKLYSSLLPKSLKDDLSSTESKTTVSTTESVVKKIITNSADDKPKSLIDDFSSADSKSTITKTVMVKSSDGDDVTTTTTTRTSSTTEDALTEDALYDTLLPKGITSPTSTLTRREIVTVDSSRGQDSPTLLSPTSTRTISSYSSYTDDSPTTHTRSYTISSKPKTEDALYDTLLPKGITSPTSTLTRREIVTVDSSRGQDSPTLLSPTSTRTISSYSSYTDDSPTTHTRSYTISSKPSYEYTSPTVHTSTTYRSSRSEDILTDPLYSKSSIKSAYASPERTVLERDLCTYCRKPFTAEAKMVVDDLKIKCHASCFKCEVCNSTLGHLKAGDTMWIYKCMVHCENCFEVTRDKWRL
ncbi:hypothetical protein LDENG_00025320 [Lucifuga dentata]|nr:hypothetical protein LDENG_00025320 [Lucifuga dentata]